MINKYDCIQDLFEQLKSELIFLNSKSLCIN